MLRIDVSDQDFDSGFRTDVMDLFQFLVLPRKRLRYAPVALGKRGVGGGKVEVTVKV